MRKVRKQRSESLWDEMSGTVKILLVQTANMNFGDTVIANNNEYLLHKAMGRRKHVVINYSISSRDIGQLKYVDAVVFAGGIIKATNEKFWIYIPELINEAERLQIPVFLSGIGVERFIPGNEASEGLKQALNLSCVKGISVRDDLETLMRDYVTNPEICLSKTTDVAVWSRWTYKEALKAARRAEDKRIGVGIVRERLFADYGHPEMTRDKQIAFWIGVIKELEQKGLPWVLFTNGDRNDENFAEEILQTIGHGDKLPTPRDGTQLVTWISQMQGVIAGRMHSNIIAYALGVPSVGFVWNQKLQFWGERIGHPERFFPVDQMDPAKMVDTLYQALDKPIRVSRQLRLPAYRALKRFARKWCRVREERMVVKDIDWSKYLVAVGMGGMELRYSSTHSREALETSLKNGFRFLHVDVRLTSDLIPVCISRWHEETFDHMNLPVEKEGYQEALPYDVFAKAKFYQRFSPLSFQDFAKTYADLSPEQQPRVILGIGKPSGEKLAVLLECLKEQFEQGQLPRKEFILRMERRADILTVREAFPDIDVMYHLAPKADTIWAEKCAKDLAWSKKNKVRYVSMNLRNYEGEIPELIRQFPVRPYIFTFVKTGRIEEAINDGVSMVGSRYYDVAYLNRLTKE